MVNIGPPDFTVTQDEDGVYHFKGELSIFHIEKLKDFLDDLLGMGKSTVISLEALAFADGAALQLLVAFMRSARSRMNVQISALSPEIQKILAVSGLDTALLGKETPHEKTHSSHR